MKETTLSLDDLFLYGAHYGKHRRFAHPAMNKYVFGYKKGTTLKIIDLEKTLLSLDSLIADLKQLLAEKKRLLFVATHPKTSQLLRFTISQTEHHYISERWCGGTLTNWKTIQARILHLKQMLKQENDPQFLVNATKRERGRFEKQKTSLMRQLEGILTMNRLPDALVLLTPQTDQTAFKEAHKLKLPVYALTNIDLDPAWFANFAVVNTRSDRAVAFVFRHILEALFPELDWAATAKFYLPTEKEKVAGSPAEQTQSSTASSPALASAPVEIAKQSPTETKEPTPTMRQGNQSGPDENKLNLETLKKLRAATLASWSACKEALLKTANDYEKALAWLLKTRQVVVDKARTNNQGLVATFLKADRAFILDFRCETDFVARNQLFHQIFQTVAQKLLVASDYKQENLNLLVQPYIQDLINKFQENIAFQLPVLVEKAPAEVFGFYNHNNWQQTALVICAGNPNLPAEEAEKLAMHIVAMEPKYLTATAIPATTLASLKTKLAAEVNEQFPDRPVEMRAKIIEGKLQKQLEVDTLMAQKFIHQPHLTVESWLKTHNLTVKQFYLRKKMEG